MDDETASLKYEKLRTDIAKEVSLRFNTNVIITFTPMMLENRRNTSVQNARKMTVPETSAQVLLKDASRTFSNSSMVQGH